MENLCTASTQFSSIIKFKLPLLSHPLILHHLHTVNGSLSFSSMCSSPNTQFNRPKISHRRRNRVQDSPQLRSNFNVSALGKNYSGASSNSDNTKEIIFSSFVTVVLAIANRVLYKLALVPMKEYPFFLAQLNTFGISHVDY
ncbi:hypothetical protein M9H77_32241 [Catharanthus roseus]|uniref:Uncharacterized protein n=1 Tax=Catharanthus roseus TaxID=4058 RepID=A0ACC0A378_CATRO|nr:hypothetical protein M9H77_32241 [Catharanthus roseus]